MAQARGKSPQKIGYYRLRAPAKLITLAELAAVPKRRDVGFVGAPVARSPLYVALEKYRILFTRAVLVQNVTRWSARARGLGVSVLVSKLHPSPLNWVK